MKNFRLRFTPALEQIFVLDYAAKSVLQTRIATLLGMIFYGSVGIRDNLFFGAAAHDVQMIRYAVVCPVLLILFGLTFLPQAKRIVHLLTFVSMIIAGLGTVAMIAVMPQTIEYRYPSFLLLLLFSYIFARLRFVYATGASLVISTVYALVAFSVCSTKPQVLANSLSLLVMANITGAFASYLLERYGRRDFLQKRELDAQHRQLEAAQEKSERLLNNMLPAHIAEQLKDTQQVIAESIPDATVLFADIVGFTKLSEQLLPEQVVGMLNDIFSLFDLITNRNGLEKIKTIGDAYMCAGGLSGRGSGHRDHAAAAAQTAIEMQAALARYNQRHGSTLSIRIGIHTGAVVAGVIGKHKLAFDLWGDTVNVASRMESHGTAGRIHVSASTYRQLETTHTFKARGHIEIKGKGAMATYFLIGKNRQSVEPLLLHRAA
ncbi:MAG: hypothetical protein IAF08_03695 [Rhizobacter sp.]|nr:hypothetical protein [Chlorobiales bacterium]